MEVLLGGEAGMLLCNEGSGYNYAQYLATALANAGLHDVCRYSKYSTETFSRVRPERH